MDYSDTSVQSNNLQKFRFRYFQINQKIRYLGAPILSHTLLKFNSKGFLYPDINISSTVDEFKKIFIDVVFTEKRHKLFTNYVDYSTALKKECAAEYVQWIDGSFVTKKANPNDIDLVTFIDYSVFDDPSHNFAKFKYPESLDIFGVDAYIVTVYPVGHKYYQLYEADWAYWMHYFNKTRRNRLGNKLKKGFLEINM